METKLLIVFITCRSKDEEIELVPETQFFRDAPKEISKPVSNFDNACVETNCNGMLRVNFSFLLL